MESKRKALHVSFVFFQGKYLPHWGVSKTVATAWELNGSWKLGALDGVPPLLFLCWTVIVYDCSWLFLVVSFLSFAWAILLSFENLFYCPYFSENLQEKEKIINKY